MAIYPHALRMCFQPTRTYGPTPAATKAATYAPKPLVYMGGAPDDASNPQPFPL